MRRTTWWQTFGMLVTAFRSVIFERFDLFVFIGWWLMTSLFALMVYWLDPVIAIGVLAFGAIMFPFFRRAIMVKKYLLLQEGDFIEYAIVTEEGLVQKFRNGRLLHALAAENVARRALFDKAHPEHFSQFYLVDDMQSNIVIPYEWIMGIELGLEEMAGKEEE